MKEHEKLRKKLVDLSQADREEDKEIFQEVVNEYIRACDWDEDVEAYNFEWLTFPEISFESGKFEKFAYFSSATFKGKVDFREAAFTGRAFFNNATFKSEVDFREVAFSGAHFISTTFKNNVYFNSAVFSGEADFREVTFSDSAYFISASFHVDTDFREAAFSGLADYREAAFLGLAYFNSTSFSGLADFREVKFSGLADFREAKFSGLADFREAKFSGSADFSSTMLLGDANFSRTFFMEDADFNYATFFGFADLSYTWFSGLAYFISARFTRSTSFSSALFLNRVQFNNCTFQDEVHFDEALFAFLKHPPGSAGKDEYEPIILEKAVLEAAHLWGIDTLSHYIFRDSFILGVSLAGKTLNNCDFTGAVMKRVFTDGWQPDKATIKNTKYIYTDYKKEEQVDEEGNTREAYVALEESRVPADGFFGEGSNAGFTIKDYFHRPYEWNYALPLPPEFRNTILQTIRFFQEYLLKTRGEEVDIMTQKEGGKIRLVFMVEKEADREHVEPVFKDYIRKLFDPLNDFEVEFHDVALSDFEKAELQRKVSLMQRDTRAEIAFRRELALIEKRDEEFVAKITEALTPIVTSDNQFIIKLIEASKPSGNIQVTQQNTQQVEQNVTVTNTTEIRLELGDLSDILEEAFEKSGNKKFDRLRKEVDELLEKVDTLPKEEAGSRFMAVAKKVADITGFMSDLPAAAEFAVPLIGKVVYWVSAFMSRV